MYGWRMKSEEQREEDCRCRRCRPKDKHIRPPARPRPPTSDGRVRLRSFDLFRSGSPLSSSSSLLHRATPRMSVVQTRLLTALTRHNIKQHTFLPTRQREGQRGRGRRECESPKPANARLTRSRRASNICRRRRSDTIQTANQSGEGERLFSWPLDTSAAYSTCRRGLQMPLFENLLVCKWHRYV